MLKVNGSNIGTIRLTHRGTNTAFAVCFYPDPLSGMDPIDDTLHVEVTDMRDIDDLIYMLNRFKENMDNHYFGKWKEKIYDKNTPN